jgi:hypothetical protein
MAEGKEERIVVIGKHGGEFPLFMSFPEDT